MMHVPGSLGGLTGLWGLEQGGEALHSLLLGQGVGWRRFRTTQPGPNGAVLQRALPYVTLGVSQGAHRSNWLQPTFGGGRAEMLLSRGWAGGSLVTCQNKGTQSRPACQPTQCMSVLVSACSRACEFGT